MNDLFFFVTEAIRFMTYEISLRTRTFPWFAFDAKVFKTFTECRMCWKHKKSSHANANANFVTSLICSLLQTDNHASTSLLNFYRPDAYPDTEPTGQSAEGW